MEASVKDGTRKFTVRNLPGSFRNAFSGIIILLRSENNAKIHVIILLLVIIAGMLLRIPPVHWIVVILVSGLVIACECFNTSLEYLSDAITSDHNINIKSAKDIAAAGVLISAITAAITGLIIFIPAIIRLIDT